MTAEEHSLAMLAAALGITHSYHDGTGRFRQASVDALVAVIRALGVPIESPGAADQALREFNNAASVASAPPLVILREGSAGHVDVPREACSFQSAGAQLVLESGETIATRVTDAGDRGFRIHLPRETPRGAHHVDVDIGPSPLRIRVLVAPERLPEAPRSWCLFAPLYGMRADRTPAGSGAGASPCYADLARLARWMTEGSRRSDRHRDTALLGTLPLVACFFEEPFEPSPYSPISRAFWSELYVDPAAAPEHASSSLGASRAGFDPGASEALRSNGSARVDYRGLMRERRKQIEALLLALDAAGGARRRELDVAIEEDDELCRYAAFRAAVELYGTTWDRWPSRARAGELRPGVDYDGETFRYHVYAQRLAREQLEEAAAGSPAGFYLDLPLGSHSGGYDTWRYAGEFAHGVSFGAPPDEVFDGGQNWGFPPLHPERARAGGYASWRAALRHHFTLASVLRVDHVMGLHRSFWIPDGFDATDGMYVRSHADELWSVLALSAAAARGGRGAAVVGEDLGTVPDEVRAEMRARGAMRMHVIPFECTADAGSPMRPAPREALVSLGTHDMEPFATWWAGDRTPREQIARFFGCDPEPSVVLAKLLAWMAASDATVICVNLEDLWLERERQNTPGSVAGDTSWQRAFARPFDDFAKDPHVRRLVDIVRGAEPEAQP